MQKDVQSIEANCSVRQLKSYPSYTEGISKSIVLDHQLHRHDKAIPLPNHSQ
jgi:hypothetical protein